MAAKKAAAKKEAETTTDVPVDEFEEQGVRENNPAGVHPNLRGPRSADLNPAFHDPT